jgi:hypothetical protein
VMTKTPRLRAVDGKVHIVGPDGFVMYTVTLDAARAMKQRKEIEPASKPGYARLIPQPLVDNEETRARVRAMHLKREREKAERSRRRKTR